MNKKIVLKIDGRKMEFSNDLLGYQHLMDYVSREVRERIPRKKRASVKPFVSLFNLSKISLSRI